MNIEQTKQLSENLCKSLYQDSLISYDDYIKCSNQSNIIKTSNISDNHKYALENDNTILNIFKKRVYITHDNKYLAIIEDIDELGNSNGFKITYTTGIFDSKNNIFEIEPIDNNYVTIKHLDTNKYISYNSNKVVELVDNNAVNTKFMLNKFNINGIIKYTFNIVKPDGSPTELFLTINNNIDNNISITNNNKFYWFIDEVDEVTVNELDNLSIKIANIQNDSTQNILEFNIIVNKIKILENLKTYLLDTVNQIFEINKELLPDDKIFTQNNRTVLRIELKDVYKNDTLDNINNNIIPLIDNKLVILNKEKQDLENFINTYNFDYNALISEINSSIDEKMAANEEIKQQIQRYNTTLMDNKLLMNIQDYDKISDENNKKIDISKINNEIKNKKIMKNNINNILMFSSIIILSLFLIIKLSI